MIGYFNATLAQKQLTIQRTTGQNLLQLIFRISYTNN